MKRYGGRGVAPPPPLELQDLIWPDMEDRQKPWLTEIGWTIVPENSDPQVMHADICSPGGDNARRPGRGRYHHFAWKTKPEDRCTTNIVPGGFSEGCATWDDYSKWSQVSGNAIIFDSEMLHRGARTKPGIGWSSTLTLQVCAGTGWVALNDRVGKNLMWYTQQIGWEDGAAVDAFIGGSWQPLMVQSRLQSGFYTVVASGGPVSGLKDNELRYRQPTTGSFAADPTSEEGFLVGTIVDALYDGKRLEAKVARRNGDGTYRVVWKADRSFSDALPVTSLRSLSKKEESASTASPWSSASSSGEEDDNPLSRKRSGRSSSSAEEKSAKRKRCAQLETPAALMAQVFDRGWAELRDGLPEAWQWEVFEFIESCFDRFSELVIQELESLRDFWDPCPGSLERHGAFAAAKVTERLKPHGVAVYSPGPSQLQEAPWVSNGPRWYISVTQRALQRWAGDAGAGSLVAPGGEGLLPAPAPPAGLLELLHGHAADSGKMLRARGLGWTLAPAGSDPQAVHADIWGFGAHTRTDRTRWPHILWKRRPGQLCTTEVVPEGFTEGSVQEEHFRKIRRASAPAIIVDSEALHRGAKVPAGAWGSTLSLELCTASGWDAWEAYETGGTTKDPTSPLDWRMLLIAPELGSLTPLVGAPAGRAEIFEVPASAAVFRDGEVVLPFASWKSPKGKALLAAEQRKWENIEG